jgi:hypothetical protein
MTGRGRPVLPMKVRVEAGALFLRVLPLAMAAWLERNESCGVGTPER